MTTFWNLMEVWTTAVLKHPPYALRLRADATNCGARVCRSARRGRRTAILTSVTVGEDVYNLRLPSVSRIPLRCACIVSPGFYFRFFLVSISFFLNVSCSPFLFQFRRMPGLSLRYRLAR